MLVFEVAARNLSFTRAAADLYVTQPAVSRMISRFEGHIGLKLFNRSTSGLTLTDDGLELYESVARGLGGIHQTIEKLQKRQSGDKVITLSASSAFATHWLLPKLHQFTQSNPALDLRFNLTGGEPSKTLNDADITVRLAKHSDNGGNSYQLFREEILVVCSESYLQAHGKLEHSKAGVSHTLLRYANPRIRWQFLLDELGLGREKFSNELTFSDYSVLLQAALAGQGLALGWRHIVEDSIEAGRLKIASEQSIITGDSYNLFVATDPGQQVRGVVKSVVDWFLGYSDEFSIDHVADL